MFYCNSCAEENRFPLTFVKSIGKCEMCGVNNIVCNDTPSNRLPKQEQEHVLDTNEFISNMRTLSHEQQVEILETIANKLSLDVTAKAIRDSLRTTNLN